TPPPGRTTRAISATAASPSNQWKASPTKTASAKSSGSGIRSAVPASTRMSAERPASTPRISSFGSTATTSANREARARVSFPEPAARSTTRESASRASTSAARSSASGAYSGRTSSYSAAIRPKLKASSDTARPVGDGADAAAYLAVGRHELAQAACERCPVFLGLVGDRADREQVRDPLVACVEHFALDLGLAQLLE